jgi:hypothetical protein
MNTPTCVHRAIADGVRLLPMQGFAALAAIDEMERSSTLRDLRRAYEDRETPIASSVPG